MRWSKGRIGALLLVGLLAGCPLEDDPQAAVQDKSGASGPDSTRHTQTNAKPGDGDDGNAPTDEGGGFDAGDGTDHGGDGSNGGGGDGSNGGGGDGSNGGGGDGSNGGGDGTSGGADGGVTDPGTGGGADAGATAPDDAGATAPADAGTPPVDPGPVIVVPDLGAPDLDDASRATLIQSYINGENYVDNWYPFFEAAATIRPLIIAPSHGTSVRVFQNAVAKQATDKWVAGGMSEALVMPNGSVVLKEVYATNKDTGVLELSQTVVMAKIDGLDPTMYEGKWFYMRITASAARVTTCVNCHNGRTAKAVWPADPNNPSDKGGKPDGVLPYDYLFGAFCHDGKNPQCKSPE